MAAFERDNIETVTDRYVKSLILAQIGPKILGGTNHDVYDPRLGHPQFPNFDYFPRCIYLYYVAINNSHSISISHYLYRTGDEGDTHAPPIQPGALQNQIQLMAEKAWDDSQKTPKPGNNFSTTGSAIMKIGDDFMDMVWKHRSYVVFIMDEPGWEFYKLKGPDQITDISPIVFNVEKGSEANKSFFDGQDITVSLPSKEDHNIKENRSGFCFVNHFRADELGRIIGKDSHGNVILDSSGKPVPEIQKFVFDMYLKAKFENKNSKPLTIIFDPGTQNDGPPLEP